MLKLMKISKKLDISKKLKIFYQMRKNLLIYIEDPRFGGPHQYTINILDDLKKNLTLK